MKITQLLPTIDKGASPERMPSPEVEVQFPPEVLARVREVFAAANNVDAAKQSMGLVEAPVRSVSNERMQEESGAFANIEGPGYTKVSDNNAEIIHKAARDLAQPASVMQGGVDAYNQAA